MTITSPYDVPFNAFRSLVEENLITVKNRASILTDVEKWNTVSSDRLFDALAESGEDIGDILQQLKSLEERELFASQMLNRDSTGVLLIDEDSNKSYIRIPVESRFFVRGSFYRVVDRRIGELIAPPEEEIRFVGEQEAVDRYTIWQQEEQKQFQEQVDLGYFGSFGDYIDDELDYNRYVVAGGEMTFVDWANAGNPTYQEELGTPLSYEEWIADNSLGGEVFVDDEMYFMYHNDPDAFYAAVYPLYEQYLENFTPLS